MNSGMTKSPPPFPREKLPAPRRAIRRFEASVTHTQDGKEQEEVVPVYAPDYESASRLAFAYVLQVLKLPEFELRIVGA
jgi:hypothetical protein